MSEQPREPEKTPLEPFEFWGPKTHRSPRLLDSDELAAKLRCTTHVLLILRGRSFVPRPASFSCDSGELDEPLWSEPKIDAWIYAGCPDMVTWNKVKHDFLLAVARNGG